MSKKVKEEDRKKVGRKSKYFSHIEPNLKKIKKLRQEGYYIEQIPGVFGVGLSTFYDYISKHPELGEALKEGKEDLIEELEDTMFRLALGKTKVNKSKKTFVRNARTGKMELDKEETSEDHLAPNATMLIFSLKNLAPDKWRDRREMDFNSDSSIEQAMTNFKLISDAITKNTEEDKDNEETEAEKE